MESGSVSAALALPAVLFSAMQGVLVMESADPCRLSYAKLRLLMGLLVLQFVFAVTAQSIAAVALWQAMMDGLRWLWWVSLCLPVLATLNLVLDFYFTVEMAYVSRVFWTPFSAIGMRSKSRYVKLKVAMQGLILIALITVTLLLMGWRQGWWLIPEVGAVDARYEAVLSTWMIGAVMGWGLFCTVGLAALLLLINGLRGAGLAEFYKHMFYPSSFVVDRPETLVIEREPTNETKSTYTMHRYITHGSTLSDSEVSKRLHRTPLHIGNAIVGPDQLTIYDEESNDATSTHALFSFVEKLSILPLLICVATSVIRLHTQVNRETLHALRSLTDASIVLGLIGFSIGVKMIIWSLIHVVTLHPADIGPDDGV